MISCLNKENIPLDYFDYIIGDNGGVGIDVKTQEQLFKYTMEREVITDVISEFLKAGGTLSDIRLTDGENIIAHRDKKVKEYYKDKKNIRYKRRIDKAKIKDITKLTLSGSKEQIDEIEKYIDENYKGYRTHRGITSFPDKKSNNYRIDFTSNNSKGQATEYMIKKLRLKRCIVLGNDLNDLSMFKVALKRGDFIVIAKNEKQEITDQIIKELRKYAKESKVKWKETNILVLQENNVNRFLHNTDSIIRFANKKVYNRKSKFINALKTRDKNSIKVKSELKRRNINKSYNKRGR